MGSGLYSAQTEVGGKVSAVNASELRDCSFEVLLLEAVDEALSLLGDASKKAIYLHLEKTFAIKKQDIPHRIEEFARAIEEIFGLGAKFLEIQIMKRLYQKVGPAFKYTPKWDNLVFTEYVEAAKLLWREVLEPQGPQLVI